MRIEIFEKMRTWNLKVFFSISLGFHLLFFSGAIFLFPDFKIDRLPPLNMEVFLLPVVAQEKPSSIRLASPRVKTPKKREEKKLPPIRPEINITPIKTLLVEDAVLERKSNGEERMEEAQAFQAKTTSLSLEPEVTRSMAPSVAVEDRTKEHAPADDQAPEGLSKPQPSAWEEVLTFIGDKKSETKDSSLATLSPPEEKTKEAKYPSSSDVEMVFSQPRYAQNPKPLYPREARRKGYQGEVVLKVEILSNGQVGQVEVKRSSGHEILDCSALAAVKEWRFIPARKGEKPVPLWVNIPIKFQLQ